MIISRSLNEATILAGACFLLGLCFGAPAEAQSNDVAVGAGAGASSVKSSYEPDMSAELPAGVSGGLDSPPSAAKAATVSRDTLVTVAELHRRLGELFEILGQYDSAQMQLKEVIAIDERLYGADHPSIIVDLTRLGAVQYRSGRYTDAAQTLSRALVMAERALGPEHQDVAPILATLGNTYNELGRLTDAEPLLKRSLAISLNASVAHDIEIAQALNNLADLYLAKGRLKESERLLLDALVRLHKGDLQPERLPTGQSLVAQLRHDRSSLRAHTDAEVTVLGAVLNNLGCLYHLRHKDTLARDLYQLAIEVKSTASGGDLLGLSTTYSNLSGSLLLSGDVEHALSMSLDACEIDSRTLPAYHPHVAIDQIGLADVYLASGQLLKARTIYSLALANLLKTLPETHADVIRCKARCAFLSRKLNSIVMRHRLAAQKASKAWSQPPFR